MIDAAAYRANETNAKRAIADWRLSNVNDPYIFQNQGFPVRADSFLDLAQILDTMQEGRFDWYMKEMGGFTDEDAKFFVDVCLDYVDFYTSFFQRERVVVPLSTLIAHFVSYKKLLGFNPGFKRVLELGPGCGYLSFFLRHHAPLADYTQIESTESFYLLQSHINAHVFGSRFAEHALSRLAVEDHGKYVPKLDWHNPFHYEYQKIINVRTEAVCNHFPWWRIGEAAERKYDIVASNANLNEFSREALFQYLSLIKDVLTDDGAIVAQCLGGGSPTYDSIFANMKTAGFVPVALVAGGANIDGRVFPVANGVFVGMKHPLYAKYANAKPQFPTLDRGMDFVNKMYFMNEDQADRKHVLTTTDILDSILDRVESAPQRAPGHAESTRQNQEAGSPRISVIGSAQAKVPAQVMDKILLSTHARDVNRMRRVVQLESLGPNAAKALAARSGRGRVDSAQAAHNEMERIRLAAEVINLESQLKTLHSSRSWKITAPMRSVFRRLRQIRGQPG
jgi:hypothetical protein